VGVRVGVRVDEETGMFLLKEVTVSADGLNVQVAK
jgi:hypothetical protein